MPIPESSTAYYLKNQLDNIIDHFATLKNPTDTDLAGVAVAASVQAGIDKYRAAAANMSLDQLEEEKHDSDRLARHLMVATGRSRPPARCHAHAIISGGHKEAAKLRAVLAWLKMRIDDPDNGCWLPENTAATPHPLFRNAVPHSRIHRHNYYRWLQTIITMQNMKTQSRLRMALKLIGRQLQDHTFPPDIMLPKGRGEFSR